MNNLKNIKKVFHNLGVEEPFLVFVYHTAEPSGVFQGDRHYDLQLCVLLSGSQDVRYSDFETEISEGQVWLASCWEPHETRATRKNTSMMVATISLETLGGPDLFHDVDWVRPFFLPPDARPQARDPQTRSRCLAIGREIAALQTEKPLGFRVLQWMRLHELILLLLSTMRDAPRPVPSRSDTPDLLRILPAIQLVKGSAEKPASLDEAAAACGMGKSHFCELFNRVTGLGFAKFAMRGRLSMAAQLLRSSKLPVKDISKRCGFSELSHFYHAFKRQFNCSPALFRKRPV